MAETLAAHQIVPTADRFLAVARFGRRARGIRAGTYPLRPGTPAGKVLSDLLAGHPPVRKLVIRERMTLHEVAEEVARRLGLAAEDIVAAAGMASVRERIGTRAPTVEGYLFPTTYYVHPEATALDVVRQMVDTFVARWPAAWYARLDTLAMTRDDAVILASIVAGEMPHPDERFQVASVYHNRLARGMRLQADPTVVYALGERRRLTYEDYRITSRYNTYTIAGLPPGPIGQPSAASLEAALYPADSEVLYMVAGPDGRHTFSRTYREHLAATRRLRSR